jgi:hypothetical protein
MLIIDDRVRGDLKAFWDKNKVETMEKSTFHRFIKQHNLIFFPVIQLQQELKKKFLSPLRWEEMTKYRQTHIKYHDFPLPHIVEAVRLNLSSFFHL